MGTYPIARPLFMYTNKYPKLGSALYQFITIHLSKDGQEVDENERGIPNMKIEINSDDQIVYSNQNGKYEIKCEAIRKE